MSWYYGAQAALARSRDVRVELDLGMDEHRMLIESLHMADRIHREASEAREAVNTGTNNIPASAEDSLNGQNLA